MAEDWDRSTVFYTSAHPGPTKRVVYTSGNLKQRPKGRLYQVPFCYQPEEAHTRARSLLACKLLWAELDSSRVNSCVLSFRVTVFPSPIPEYWYHGTSVGARLGAGHGECLVLGDGQSTGLVTGATSNS